MKCEMQLIEGEVIFRLRVATLTNNKTTSAEDLLEVLAYEQLAGSGECEVEIDNIVPVCVDGDISRDYCETFITNKEWETIIENSKTNNLKEE